MKAKVLRENRNPVLKRRELLIEVIHDDASGTPERQTLRKFLASQLNEKLENLFLLKVEGRKGADKSLCHVEIYDDRKNAEEILPKHIINRNVPLVEGKAGEGEKTAESKSSGKV
jgi:ribosomal protein S24E